MAPDVPARPPGMRLCLCALGLALAGASALPAGAAQAVTCLHYEPETVTVIGRLSRETYPGPSNYESVDSGDEAEPGFYLTPPAPLCFIAEAPDPMNGNDSNVAHIQLVLDSAGYEHFRPYLDQTVAARGRAISAFTGHHHAPVLLQVDAGPLDPGSGSPLSREAH